MGLQYEISAEALAVLESTTDARGRKLQVFKVPLPPNLFITEEEEAGLKVRPVVAFHALCPP
jgi:agmatine deiminase